MKLEDFAFVVAAKKGFEETVVSVLKSVEKMGWSLFQVYDIQERLAAKGFPRARLKIVEICSAKNANEFLNKNPLSSLCMPCRISVLEENGKVVVAGVKPSIASEFFPEISKEDALQVESDLKEIISSAVA